MYSDWWSYIVSERFFPILGLHGILIFGIVIIRHKELAVFMRHKVSNLIIVFFYTFIIILLLSIVDITWLPLTEKNVSSLTKTSGICIIESGKRHGGVYL